MSKGCVMNSCFKPSVSGGRLISFCHSSYPYGYLDMEADIDLLQRPRYKAASWKYGLAWSLWNLLTSMTWSLAIFPENSSKQSENANF